jgi:hypothetical protein
MKDSYYDIEHGVIVNLLHGDPYSIISGISTQHRSGAVATRHV